MILCVFEVWNYHRRKKGLFADYINAFVKGKQEAAGWPKGCVSPEERTKYINDYENAEGVWLDESRIGETQNKTLYNLKRRCRKERSEASQINAPTFHLLSFSCRRWLERQEVCLSQRRDPHVALEQERLWCRGSKKGSVVHTVFTTSLT